VVNRVRIALIGTVVVIAGLLSAACGSSDDKSDTVVLVTHDSFAVSPAVIKKFEKQTGLSLKILKSGDAGVAINQAILTKGKPQGDVFFGVDNTFLSRALDKEVFTSYRASDLDKVDKKFQLDSKNRVTPIDYGDVCVNFDKSFFGKKALAPPATLEDLTKPEYKNQLVVENPATSSPGLAFLLASVGKYGTDGYQDYWQKLKANGVEVVDGWEQAYNERFSAGAGANGDRSLVVSYASSPVAAVSFSEPQPTESPIGVSVGTCFRQIEFAGLLKGAKNSEGGKKLINFLLSPDFQADIPLQMFVSPVRNNVKVPITYSKHIVKIEDPITLKPSEITKNREQWIKGWKSTVLG
jgi:thiamine transport system substrate-binding protein